MFRVLNITEPKIKSFGMRVQCLWNVHGQLFEVTGHGTSFGNEGYAWAIGFTVSGLTYWQTPPLAFVTRPAMVP